MVREQERRGNSVLSFAIIAAAVLATDQVSKLLIVNNLRPYQSIPETGLLRLTHVTNSGSAFGLLQGQTAFLVLVSIIGVLGVLFYYRANGRESALLRYSLGLLLGGALGNLTDRLIRGEVVDFINVQLWSDFYFPTFNVADSALTIGLGMLALYVLRQRAQEKQRDREYVLERAPPPDDPPPAAKNTTDQDNDIEERADRPSDAVDVDELVVQVPTTVAERRLDRFLTGQLDGVTRSAIGHLIEAGLVTINGELPRKRGHTVDPGDTIVVTGPIAPLESSTPAAERQPLVILYEDDDLLAINKTAGVAVHPGPGHRTGTIVNALLGREGPLSAAGGEERPGIVHRLDKDTSGVMLIAKTDAAHMALSKQFQSRSVEKVYVALLRGMLTPESGTIEAAIARDPQHRQRMAVAAAGRAAVTDYRVLAHMRGFTLVEAQPRTGRSHQIRVHFASLRRPVAGDVIYSRGGRDPVPRLFLHALSVTFAHPRDERPIYIRCPLADDLAECLEELTESSPEAAIVASLR